MPCTMISVYELPRIAVEQFRPVWERSVPETHFEFGPPTASCGGSRAANADAGAERAQQIASRTRTGQRLTH